jgi:arginyl-tRNA synthetase
MNIEENIKESISKAFRELYGAEIEENSLKLESTSDKFEGNISFVVFPYLRMSKKKPEETAEEIGAYLLEQVEEISAFNVIKGFLNLSLSDAHWLSVFNEVNGKQNPGKGDLNKDHKVMVEYSSPNTNKPLHLGHIRNNLLGYSVSEILAYSGLEVVKSNMINDRGIHICKSMVAWVNEGNGETPESSGMKGDHLVGKYYVVFDQIYKKQIAELIEGGMDEKEAEKAADIMQQAKEMLLKWEAEEPETRAIWEKMNGWVYDGFESTYNRMGVDFDKNYYESDTYIKGKEFVEEGLSTGVFEKREDGSVWINLNEFGLDEKLVLRGDGTSLYMTQDLGTAQLKFDDFGCDKSIYVVGNEQEYHFKVLQLILQKLGKPYADGIFHLSYGMVDLPSGKMKSREGTVVDADDLMEEMFQTAKRKTEELGKTDGMSEGELNDLYEQIGQAALKYYLLKVDPKKKMMFNPEESIDFQGDTGPFIQYTYARIQSILRSAGEVEVVPFEGLELAESEKDIIQLLEQFGKKVQDAADAYSPSIIANYCFDLAKSYNRMYNELSILGEKDQDKRNFRIQLSQSAAEVIKTGLKLLGIQSPIRM